MVKLMSGDGPLSIHKRVGNDYADLREASNEAMESG